jgi:hypothetical protein
MNLANKGITYYYTELKRAGLGHIADSSDPKLREKGIMELYFTGNEEIIRLDDKELFVSKGWGTAELATLIEILGYGDRVSSNMK